MEVSLAPEFEQLVSEKLESGTYSSASEVIQEGLRLLKERDERRQQQLQELKHELAIGLEEADRGELAPLDVEGIKAEGRRLLARNRRKR
jgi:antitoxin ParD1/3/4